MCRPRPGTRCSDYSINTYNITKRRLQRNITQLEAYEEKYADSLANTENPSGRDLIRQQKHARLKEAVELQKEAVTAAEYEYHASPAGHQELRHIIQEAETAGDEIRAVEATVRLESAEAYREDQKESLRTLQTIEQEQGLEAAEQKGWEMYQQAVEDELTAKKNLTSAELKLLAAQAEAEEYERALNEYREQDRVDTPEEEAAKERARKRQLALLIAAGAAVLSFSLVHSAATGKKSSLLQYGKSIVMRQVMTGGRQTVMKLVQGDKAQLDAKEKRAEQEAERRAAEAREKILREATEAERREIRERERESERLHRAQLKADELEAQRSFMEEQLAHFQKLQELGLTPEERKAILSQVPKPRQPKQKTQQPEPVAV